LKAGGKGLFTNAGLPSIGRTEYFPVVLIQLPGTAEGVEPKSSPNGIGGITRT
jgi:hypothetical protein